MSFRILDKVIGHQATVAKLLHLVESGRLPSSWLFIGARAQGKKLIALGIAQAFLCEKSRVACGECPSCRRVFNRQSESLTLIEPEKGQIKIETARQIVSELSLSTLGRGRFVIIDDAEKLGPQAANALLKSIEEPPPRTHFILLAPSQDSILRTLRSRSQIVRFATLSSHQLEQLGREGVDVETKARALQILEGALAQSVSRDETVAVLREHVSDRETALLHIKIWLEMTREAWVSRSVLADVALEDLSACSVRLLQAERDINGNCDVNLTLENWLYQTQSASNIQRSL